MFDDFIKKIRQGMGISDNEKSNFNLNVEFDTLWRDAIIPEIEISKDDENFIWTDEGIFYSGRRVVLYIRDQAQYGEHSSEYKFHLTGCQTLKAMYKQKKYDKYVVSQNTNGKFKVNVIVDNRPTEIETELHVCKFCLKKLNWQGYKKAPPTFQKSIYEKFSIAEFFKEVNNDNQKNFPLVPNHTDATAPLNLYPKNWNDISKFMKEEANYTCSQCHRFFPQGRGLQVHHINSIKSDCSRSNLEVLCANCHQTRHNHKILRISYDDDIFI